MIMPLPSMPNPWLLLSPSVFFLLEFGWPPLTQVGVTAGAEFVQLVEMVDLDNVTFTKSVRLSENGTLVDDMQQLDDLYSVETAQRMKDKIVKLSPREEEEKPRKQRGDSTKMPLTEAQADDDKQRHRLEARILLVGDHSLHETFLKLYGQDEYAAYTALSRYLLGVFTQLETIFARLSFSGVANSTASRRIFLKLAGPPMIIVRAEDCPLRGPMLAALQQNLVAANTTASSILLSSSAPDGGDVPSSSLENATTTMAPIQNVTTLRVNDEDELVTALATGIEGWNRMDGLRAVKWIHRWIEHSEALLPSHDHVMVLSRMDLISQRNDSATQGMAYVRAICRGADSVSISVVEDVGGLSTATVAAHELSHSLGAFHDGSDVNANCSARQNFLMAPISASHTFNEEFGDTFPNAFALSECSKRQIEQFLSSTESKCLWQKSSGTFDADADGSDANFVGQKMSFRAVGTLSPNGGDAANAVLLKRMESEDDDYPPSGVADKQPGQQVGERIGGAAGDGGGAGEWWSTGVSRGHGKPGQQFDPGKQCQIVFGNHYGICRRKDFLLLNADPCRRLWCKNRQQRRWAPCETKGFLPMMDGTRCADGKWCIRGVCTVKDKLRKRSDQHAQSAVAVADSVEAEHDDGHYQDLNPSFCASFDAQQLRSFCRVLNFARICSAKCHPKRRRSANKRKVIKRQK